MKKPELLIGVGNFSSTIAAVKNGADAIYFGIKGFNMRDLGTNFTLKELKKIMQYLHENKVKGYLALNTVIFEEELNKIKKIIKKAKEAKVDAIIASDLGVMSLIKKEKIPIIVSTQMSIANSLALEQIKKLGAKKVVLARELDLKQIKSITKKAKKIGIEIEVFIHGAMCISVSGRCFLSHELFGRSANRGECLQPCRRAFFPSEKTLGKNESSTHAQFLEEKSARGIESSVHAHFLDGDKPNYEKKELEIRGNTILSAKDMKTLDFLDKVVATGVSSLKVEGRTKPSDYVATVTRTYREALDAIVKKEFTKNKIKKWNQELEKVYNRKFSSGFYLKKPTAKDITDIEGSNQKQKRVHVGFVKKYYAKINVAEIQLTEALAVGDEIIIEGVTTFLEQKVESMQIQHKEIKKAKKGQFVGLKVKERVRKNDNVFKLVERK
jgi:U32 family peptidase